MTRRSKPGVSLFHSNPDQGVGDRHTGGNGFQVWEVLLRRGH